MHIFKYCKIYTRVAIAATALVCITLPAWTSPNAASKFDWEATNGWIVSAKDSLSVVADGDTYAWNTAVKPADTWSLSADINITDMKNGIGASRLVFGDSTRKPLIIISVEHHITGISLITVKLRDQLFLNTVGGGRPGGDSSYHATISRNGNSIRVKVYGNKGLEFVEDTPKIDEALLNSIAVFGVGSSGGSIEFSNITFQSPVEKPGHYRVLADSAMDDLLRNYWTGGPDEGYIIPTYGGYHGAASSPMPKGSMWERSQMLFAMDTYYQATGDPLAKRRIAAEWSDIKKTFTKEELVAAGSIVHPACDDCGWDSMVYLVIYKDLGDPYALEVAKGLIDNAFKRWLNDDFGGGMRYDNRKMKSLCQAAEILCALQIWKATGDKTFHDRAMNCYNWVESHLLRPDGIYWCDYGWTSDGPELADRPNDIFEGGSVSFFGGNMGMAVVHAYLYRITGDEKYLRRAIRTAEGIFQKETRDGIYLNDRDAWSNGTFAGYWVRDVLSLPGIDAKHKDILLKTADAIYKNARTPYGYYGGCWNGPADGPDSPWSVRGFKPQQITTSTSTANMIMGAALAEKVQR
ncbi:MAG: glycoside hydrolase family 76 protein [Armatimonadota bacterium]|nr:hypothetical protein [bacterium]